MLGRSKGSSARLPAAPGAASAAAAAPDMQPTHQRGHGHLGRGRMESTANLPEQVSSIGAGLSLLAVQEAAIGASAEATKADIRAKFEALHALLQRKEAQDASQAAKLLEGKLGKLTQLNSKVEVTLARQAAGKEVKPPSAAEVCSAATMADPLFDQEEPEATRELTRSFVALVDGPRLSPAVLLKTAQEFPLAHHFLVEVLDQIAHLPLSAEPGLLPPEEVVALCELLEASTSASAAEHGAYALCNVATAGLGAMNLMGECGVVDLLLKWLDTYQEAGHEDILAAGLLALGVLGEDEANEQKVIASGGIEKIMDTLRDHGENPKLTENGLFALGDAAKSPVAKKLIMERGTGLLVATLAKNAARSTIAQKACRAIYFLASDSSAFKAQLIDAGVLLPVIDVLHQCKGSEKAVENACVVLLSMLDDEGGASAERSDAVLQVLVDQGAIPVLGELLGVYATEKALCRVVLQMMSRLGLRHGGHDGRELNAAVLDASEIATKRSCCINVLKVCVTHAADASLVQLSLTTMMHLIKNYEPMLETARGCDMPGAVLSALQRQPDAMEVAEPALACLWLLAFKHMPTKVVVGGHGGIELILAAMQRHDARAVREHGFTCISNVVAKNKPNRQIAGQSGVVEFAVEAFRDAPKGDSCQSLANTVLSALVGLLNGSDENVRRFYIAGGSSMLQEIEATACFRQEATLGLVAAITALVQKTATPPKSSPKSADASPLGDQLAPLSQPVPTRALGEDVFEWLQKGAKFGRRLPIPAAELKLLAREIKMMEVVRYSGAFAGKKIPDARIKCLATLDRWDLTLYGGDEEGSFDKTIAVWPLSKLVGLQKQNISNVNVKESSFALKTVHNSTAVIYCDNVDSAAEWVKVAKEGLPNARSEISLKAADTGKKKGDDARMMIMQENMLVSIYDAKFNKADGTAVRDVIHVNRIQNVTRMEDKQLVIVSRPLDGGVDHMVCTFSEDKIARSWEARFRRVLKSRDERIRKNRKERQSKMVELTAAGGNAAEVAALEAASAEESEMVLTETTASEAAAEAAQAAAQAEALKANEEDVKALPPPPPPLDMSMEEDEESDDEDLVAAAQQENVEAAMALERLLVDAKLDLTKAELEAETLQRQVERLDAKLKGAAKKLERSRENVKHEKLKQAGSAIVGDDMNYEFGHEHTGKGWKAARTNVKTWNNAFMGRRAMFENLAQVAGAAATAPQPKKLW